MTVARMGSMTRIRRVEMRDYRGSYWKAWIRYNGGWSKVSYGNLLSMDNRLPEESSMHPTIIIRSVPACKQCGTWAMFQHDEW